MVGIIAVVLMAFLVVIAGIVFWRRRRSAGKFERCVCGASAHISMAAMLCHLGHGMVWHAPAVSATSDGCPPGGGIAVALRCSV